MQRDDAYLLDIALAAQDVGEFIRGYDKSAFLKDSKTQAAVLHRIIIMGEAGKRLSEPYRSQHPEISWRAVAGMRDRVIHQYDRVDLNLVWDIISADLPDLLRKLQPLLPREDAQP